MKRFFLISTFLIVILSSCTNVDYGNKNSFINLDIYTNSYVNKLEIKNLYRYFKQKNLISSKKQSIQVIKIKNRFIIKLIKNNLQNNIEIPTSYFIALQELAMDISKKVFNGEYCEIHISNNKFETIEIIF